MAEYLTEKSKGRNIYLGLPFERHHGKERLLWVGLLAAMTTGGGGSGAPHFGSQVEIQS